MGWLQGWTKRKRLVINGASVSGTHTDIPLAFELTGTHASEVKNVIDTYDYSLATPDDTHNLGSNYEGVDGFSQTVSNPTVEGDYVTFNGTDQGLYKGSDWGDSSNVAVYAKFRIHDKNKNAGQVIWKDGGNGNGFAIGLDASNNLGVFYRNTSLTSITIPNTEFEENVWYEMYTSHTRIVLFGPDGALVAYKEGVTSPANGGDPESIGFAKNSSPLTGAASDSDYFDGDIDRVYIYSPESNITNPIDDGTWDIAFTDTDGTTALSYEIDRRDLTIQDRLTFYVKMPTISGGANKTIYMYYGNPLVSGTIYTPTDVWSSSEHMGVYHFTFDEGFLVDSTGNYNFETVQDNPAVTSGSVGYAGSFDGTNDGYTRAANMNPHSNGTNNESMVLIVMKTTTSGQQGILWKEGGNGQGHGIGFDNGKIVMADSGNNTRVETSSDQYFDGNWHAILCKWHIGNSVEMWVDGVSQGTDGSPDVIGSADPWFAYTDDGEPIWETGVAGKAFDGDICESRIYSSLVTDIDGYAATLYENLINNSTFFTAYNEVALFTNPSPYQTTVYNRPQALSITTDTDGEVSGYYINFYDADGDILLSTVSGADGLTVTTSGISGWNAGTNVWYASISGVGNSLDFSFTLRFTCSGTVTVNDTAASGIQVRLYRRSDGSLVGSTTSSGLDGGFLIVTDYDEYHFVVAFAEANDTNAEIYDWIRPE